MQPMRFLPFLYLDKSQLPGHRLGSLPDWMQCGCRTRNGAPCRNPKAKGFNVCRMHGANKLKPTPAKFRRMAKALLQDVKASP